MAKVGGANAGIQRGLSSAEQQGKAAGASLAAFVSLAPKAEPQAKVLSGAIHTARLSQSPLRTVHRCIVRSLVLLPAEACV
jgi:hypothetical protein